MFSLQTEYREQQSIINKSNCAKMKKTTPQKESDANCAWLDDTFSIDLLTVQIATIYG